MTNPSAGTVADFTVATSADTVADGGDAICDRGERQPRGPCQREPRAPPGRWPRTPSPTSRPARALTGGTSTVTLQAPPGTVFPNDPGSYTVQDSTTPSAQGPVTAPLSGGGTNDVTMTVPGSVNAGDLLDLTVEDAINPSSASSCLHPHPPGQRDRASRPSCPFPDASVSYPNGAIVSFSGTDYVFAGGPGLPGPGTHRPWPHCSRVDHAQAQAAPPGARPPTGAPRPGTLLFTRPVDGTATIYVVGTDGELHGFATPRQFLSDGYDPALVVTVTEPGAARRGRLRRVRRCRRQRPLHQRRRRYRGSSGAFYVLAGGRAFGIPTAGQAGDRAQEPTRLASSKGHIELVANLRRPRRRRAAHDIGHGLRQLPGRPLPVQVHGPAPGRRLRRVGRRYRCRPPQARRSYIAYSGDLNGSASRPSE